MRSTKMKIASLVLFLFSALIFSAQTFMAEPKISLFKDDFSHSIAFADVEGKSNQYDLLTAPARPGEGISSRYANGGQVNFIEKEDTPFEKVVFSSIATADIDGDNDQDVLITGANNSFDPITELYTNDGFGNFTKKDDVPFENVSLSSVAFMDVDGDDDQDVLISGQLNGGDRITKLYTNDGVGEFTKKVGTPFDSVSNGSIAFMDVDGDGDPDVLITGRNNSGEGIAILYINDGSGNFIEKPDLSLAGVFNGSTAFADVDGNGAPDILLTGQTVFGERLAKLYTNDGEASFTEKTDTPFEGGTDGATVFADLDGDSDPDLLLSWINVSGERNTTLYINDGHGNFTEKTDTPFEGVAGGSIAFADVDGDSDPDVLLTGQNSLGLRIAKLYINNGDGAFTEKTDAPFEGVAGGSLSFADVNGDKNPDVLITGQNNEVNNISKLYINQGVISSAERSRVKSHLDIELFPNPSKTGPIHIRYDAQESGFIDIGIYNIGGIQLRQQRKFFVAGQQHLSVDISFLSKGQYLISLSDRKRTGVASFVVQ